MKKKKQRGSVETVPMPDVPVGPSWRGWSWNILPQEGQIHLAIYRVTMGNKAFLAYSGIGTADFSRATALTQKAMGIMAELTRDKHIWLDIRQREPVSWRVISAFHGAENGGMLLFVSETDELAGAVNAFIQQGEYQKAAA